MKVSIFTKLVLPILFVFALLVLTLGSLIGARLRHEQISNAQNIIASFTVRQAQQHLNENDFILNPANYSKFLNYLSELTIDDVLRIKVWDREGNIIFSDAPEIIGKNFADNEDFIKAVNGEISTDIADPVDPDNIAEQGYTQLMEVYVPIRFEPDSDVSGVVETYFIMDQLNSEIKESQRAVFSYLFFSILLVFLLVATFVYVFVKRPIFELRNAADQIAAGKMNISINKKGTDEIGELARSLDEMRMSLKLVMEEYESKIKHGKKKRTKSKT